MIQICFASNNAHKKEEIQKMLPENIQLVTLQDIGCTEELPETGSTLEENSLQKAKYVYDHFKIACIADDSGLEVDVLNGKPGVDTAHYSGSRDATLNNNFLLQNMQGANNRFAKFRTIITYIDQSGTFLQFDGEVEGQITEKIEQEGGFGYDPVFVPLGHTVTFAQMSLEEKNQISHRARAIFKLNQFLKSLF